ncbi:MAG TPA: T9SS type A sorting domain-containing protein, partial [Rhodothermales bacterium]|nr:T9SS type A sorting domain-containing protein [Rhodothermales bacterium]
EDGALAFWLDTDLGDATDDYLGTDTARGLAYTYNADDNDTGPNSYGVHPPAFGVDFLDGDGLGYNTYYNGGAHATGDPGNALEYYRNMRAIFREGQPLTFGADGTIPANPQTHFIYPGAPGNYWSEGCNNPACTGSNTPTDRRYVPSVPPFRLEPGESRTFNFALLFARGASNLASVEALRAASDRIQGLHDSGALYGPALGSSLTLLATPALTGPADGAALPVGDDEVTLTWAAVPGAARYEVRVDTSAVPFQGAASTHLTTTPSLRYALVAGGGAAYHWRVRAQGLGSASPYSATRSFTSPGFALPGIEGAAVVEVARPGGADPCAGAPVDPGCAGGLGGNTVFHDGDTGADYYVSGGGGNGETVRLNRYAHMASPDYYEIRFTAGGGYGLYFPPDNHVVRVPFELWNVRTTLTNASDDVRMIPIINPQTAGDTPPDWANHFTGTDAWTGRPRPVTPVTDWVYWMMPDRPGGYALFETAALGFGGPGALYDPTADGDTQVDISPYHGTACTNQGTYVAWCYRNGEVETNTYPTQGAPGSQFVYPIGRLVFADLAGDGTTPLTGTVVRFRSALLGSVVQNEPLPTGPVTALAVERVAPNPVRGRATVAYAVPVAGRVVVAVYDALGRRVAVVQDGPVAAGRHEAELNTAGLSPGVYVVVVESGGARAARTLAVVR